MSARDSDVQWVAIPDSAGMYEVSSDGQVRSWHKSNGRPLPHLRKACPVRSGHLVVMLKIGGKSTPRHVHRLVAEAFLGPRPDGMQTRHLNGNAIDNRAENLRYGTARENALDSVQHGTHPQSSKAACPQGHTYNEANTRVYRDRRHCRTCERGRCKTQAAA